MRRRVLAALPAIAILLASTACYYRGPDYWHHRGGDSRQRHWGDRRPSR